jgi:hypothetical protein
VATNIQYVLAEKGKDVFPNYYVENNLIHANGKKKVFLGDREKKVCRFCRRDASEATFGQDAHLLPEFMGNKVIFSYFECDECNATFSKYETAFTNYFGIHHSLARLKGKKKVPTYDSKKEKFSIVIDDESINLLSGQGNNSVTIDEQAQVMTIKTIRPSYIPCNVLKCLVKIGLSAVKEDELVHFEQTRKWLIDKSAENARVQQPCSIVYYNIGGGLRTEFPFVALLNKRKEAPVPNSAVLISYEHFKFQFFMPLDGRDDLLMRGTKVLLPIQGLLVREREEGIGPPFFWKDLSGTEKVIGEEHVFSLGISDGKFTM